MKNLLAGVLLTLLAACAASGDRAPAPGPTPHGQRELGLLASFLPGTWETLPRPGIAPLTLRMVEFWKDPQRANERWIYAEYVGTHDASRPVIQRIYRLSEAGGKISAAVYGVPGDDLKYAGAWRQPRPFEGVEPDDLPTRPGCRIEFVLQHGVLFAGGTVGRNCRSRRPEVAYERSEFYLSSSSLRNLEQGYDAAGRVISGEGRLREYRRMSREAR